MLASLGCSSVSGRGSRPMARREVANHGTRLLRSDAFWGLIVSGIQEKNNNATRGRPPGVFRGWLRYGDVVRPGAGIGVIAPRVLGGVDARFDSRRLGSLQGTVAATVLAV